MSTKIKVNYGTEETPDGYKTLNNMNPESTNEDLVLTVNKMAGMQKKVVRSIERIDTTTISG